MLCLFVMQFLMRKLQIVEITLKLFLKNLVQKTIQTQQKQQQTESKEQGKASCKEKDVKSESNDISSGNEVESDCEDEELPSSQPRVLRDRNALVKPKRLKDYVVLAEVYLADHDKPENYLDAINS